ncbi:hypothetical protein PHYSODRAFT_337636 [Phytophthora sojae]|uniref:Peptidase A2 domain-containing protein n=1 Tax=Phytophthora sojae (strain P6497) TaxID=1094619 RepID=G5A1R6_PHYSP|nr:hypothetical protein PHYSODRAFT_337636 [Phytophthora sojae]EGZ10864.1 hypothetical protein PHYSODRAFT_337636 [Phytophthora sojae]|eukprot:XP_009533609.1 hypothetical protein PHYSODRAFT_337636 [Phytophthora sojae]
MEVADSEALEKKLRARQRGLFRQKAPTPPGEPARRNFDPDDSGRDRPRCHHCGSRRHAEGDCWKLLTCQKCGGQHPTERCLRVCKACGDVHEAGECPMEEFFNQLRQWFDPNKHAGMLPLTAEKIENPTSLNDNTCESNLERTTRERAPRISAVRRTTDDAFAREPPLDEVDLQPGERRGYWKHYAPHKWYKQAKMHGKLNNHRAVLLLDTGAEVSILDTTFARENQSQDYLGWELGVLHARVGDLVCEHAILGMNFMVPGGVRIDTADGTACLPDEVHIQMIGRRPLYGARMHPANLKTPVRLEPGDTHEVWLMPDRNAPFLWVTRAESWVTTSVKGRVGRKTYLRVTNIGDAAITLASEPWVCPTGLPSVPAVAEFGVRRDAEENWIPAELDGPVTDHPSYPTPKAILRPEPRQLGMRRAVTPVLAAVAEAPKGSGNTDEEAVEVEPDGPPNVAGSAVMEESPESKLAEPKLDGPKPAEPELDEAEPDEQEEDDAVLIHEGSDLFAEDLESEMAVLPDLSLTAEVKIEDLKVGMPTGLPPQEAARQETRLRQIIWKRRKWLIGKGNALPPAALGVVCDIDVGDAKSVAQRVRKIPPQFREKVADLIKGLLSARMIQKSKSPWASPIVVIIKKNGVDIRL